MIKMQNLSKSYFTEDLETTPLKSLNFNIEAGDFVAVMGPSGCGKSTLLNIVGLLDIPTDGSYEFLSEEMSNKQQSQLSKIRKQNIGFIFQSFNLIDELTVYENIELPLLYRGEAADQRKLKVTQILEKMGIAHRASHYPKQLSGGQQQRVAVCRALITEPSLILADEPTGNLDSASGEEVMNTLVELNKQGCTIMMVTHSDEHAKYASRIVRMLDGQFVSDEADLQSKIA
ncbi:putative ABC transporter ATP-binding protein YknY [Pseudoalteromonas holothuriae]|uniref:ABC transporter ATP-binding protein YknY n=1 Tax=Pseudoalteromonas holothuriae TaxID=2963714 RepID=A0A9W4QTD7_9GAMM|nr:MULTISPECIES: ABC transporter ATP-binding protein [unclassified Pseudoalteromonas]CAH9050324.1 putative ABC transporter ATP-binding protein YknY [Pseudoalteromonas sp. CIP111951]CAH9052351.1 putative ABC transporter ATP-binding protein YknY [Pseudoalteromonas sp. CIP111854]